VTGSKLTNTDLKKITRNCKKPQIITKNRKKPQLFIKNSKKSQKLLKFLLHFMILSDFL
jgi:hypothetical protein